MITEHLNSNFPIYVPVATSFAGGCLTHANWQEIGIHTISCSLEALLIKPGLKFLQSVPNFKNYLGWSRQLVLNASQFPLADKQGCYHFRSPYDGSRIQVNKKELSDLISHLQPDFILLPQDFDTAHRSFPHIMSFLPFIDQPLSKTPFHSSSYEFYGEFKAYSENSLISEKTGTATFPKNFFCIAKENVFSSLVKCLHSFFPHSNRIAVEKAFFFETDLPAQDAFLGKVYSRATTVLKNQNAGEKLTAYNDSRLETSSPAPQDPAELCVTASESVDIINLADPLYQSPHQVIDENCKCPTCSQGLTQVYLQHLFFNTPGLCQRFLMQHNVYYLNHLLRIKEL